MKAQGGTGDADGNTNSIPGKGGDRIRSKSQISNEQVVERRRKGCSQRPTTQGTAQEIGKGASGWGGVRNHDE